MWVFTAEVLEAAPMMQSLLSSAIIAHSKGTKMDLRIADQISAYQWINSQNIEPLRVAKHTSKITNDVSDLLRLTLLVNNGGFMLSNTKVIMLESADSVYQRFKKILSRKDSTRC